MQKILIGTTNPGKITEMKALFDEYSSRSFTLVTPDETGTVLDVKEDGKTYRANAGKKALAYSRASGLAALADDSGLEVMVLQGRPGLFSARYTGKPDGIGLEGVPGQGLNDAGRRAALIAELKAYPRPWQARFFCAAALTLPDGTLYHTEGDCRGEIVPQERGSNGFGYDPIFQIGDPAFGGVTMAELTLQQKNRVSHRAHAVQAAIRLLESLLEA